MSIAELNERIQRLSSLRPEDKQEGVIMERTEMSLESKEDGFDGIYWIDGLPENMDRNGAYRPIIARGNQGWLGDYQQLAKTSEAYKDGLRRLTQSLITGNWEIDPDPNIDEDLEDAHYDMVNWGYDAVYKAIDYNQFLTEWSTSLTCGFAIWEMVFNKDSTLKKLAFRRQMTVEKWIFDKDERELLAVCFQGQNGKIITIPASKLLIYSHNRTGTNFEGESHLRSLAFYIELQQFLMKNFAYSVEVNGLGMKVIENVGNDYGDDREVVKVVGSNRASSNGVISLPQGKTLKWLSPNGQIMDSLSMVRYCDEVVKASFASEGSLLGFTNVGSFALMSEKASQQVATAQYYGNLVARLIQPVLNMMVADKYGPQEYYPVVTFKATKSAEVSPEKIDQFLKLQGAGMPVNKDDWNIFRKSLGLAPIIDDGAEDFDPELEASCCGTHKKKDTKLTLSADYMDYRKDWNKIEGDIAKVLQREGKAYRTAWVNTMGSTTSPAEVMARQSSLANREQIIIEAIKPLIRDFLVVGSATVLKELGVIPNINAVKGRVPAQELEQWVDFESQRIGKHYFATLNGYLLQQTVEEFDRNVARKLPTIMTDRATKTLVSTYTGTLINRGRDAVIKTAISLSDDDKPIIATRTSVLEESSCDPCIALDGVNHIVGSQGYYRDLPPAHCMGRARCRCIYTYTMPDSGDYIEVLKSVLE